MDRDIKIFYVISVICLIATIILVIISLLQKRKLIILISFFFFSFEIIVNAIPCILDFQDAMSGNYQTISGTAVTDSKNGRSPWRTVTILDEMTGDHKQVMVFTERIHQGDYLKVNYLKYTSFGIVIERD